jgi:subtilisin
MASPDAGEAALCNASHPAASPAGVRRALQRTGNLGWSNADDPDGVKEPLVNVDAL